VNLVRWALIVCWRAVIALWLAARIISKLISATAAAISTLRQWGGPSPGGALGSARFASLSEMIWSGVRRGKGPIVGRIGRYFLRFNRDGMIAVFAPMGAGKGVGIVIPNLLSYPGSIVCTDIKGENHAITQRRRRTFGPVYVLDTTQPGFSDGFNPLDMVRLNSWHEKDDAEALAKLMVVPDGNEGHWDSKAEGLLACLILHTVRLDDARRNLAHIRTLSCLPPQSLLDLLRTIATTGTRAAAELAGSFLNMEGSAEFKSVLSNAEKATRVWSIDSTAGAITAASTFQLAQLIDGVATLYLIVDEEKLGIYAGFLRVMVGCVINALTRAKDRKRPKYKVMLLLDEAAALGSLEPLERGVGYLRAYCTPILVFQDMAQLRHIYRRSGSFLANAACKVFFNVADLDAARLLSEMIGQMTVLVRNDGTSHTNVDVVRQNLSTGRAESGRSLLDPAEVMRLPGSRSLVLYRSDILRFPVLARKVNYRAWWHWYWWGKYDRWRPTKAPAHERALVPMPPDQEKAEFANASADEAEHLSCLATPEPCDQGCG
jgi:type IV secretion system protein VirD4